MPHPMMTRSKSRVVALPCIKNCECEDDKNNWIHCSKCDATYCDMGCCDYEEGWTYDDDTEKWMCLRCFEADRTFPIWLFENGEDWSGQKPTRVWLTEKELEKLGGDSFKQLNLREEVLEASEKVEAVYKKKQFEEKQKKMNIYPVEPMD